ncbi:MAG: aminotransferase class V-fold PLP-dependent enzyme, partial [Defluviitaleaceae bacterium]|nr:aminotransferase class V-fold PLP-dependent enzyme [Defluviitaleaceae bacterium]
LEKYPKVRINSPKDGSPYILNVSVQGVKGDDFQAALDRRGVCVSVKSACSAPGTPSRPVFAVSRDKKNAACSWRIGFSYYTEMAEIEGFLTAFDECYNEELK